MPGGEEEAYVFSLILQATKARFSRATKKVLACSHSRSLQLLPTASGNQAKLDARSEFESRQRLVMQQAVECDRARCRATFTVTIFNTEPRQGDATLLNIEVGRLTKLYLRMVLQGNLPWHFYVVSR